MRRGRGGSVSHYDQEVSSEKEGSPSEFSEDSWILRGGGDEGKDEIQQTGKADKV